MQTLKELCELFYNIYSHDMSLETPYVEMLSAHLHNILNWRQFVARMPPLAQLIKGLTEMDVTDINTTSDADEMHTHADEHISYVCNNALSAGCAMFMRRCIWKKGKGVSTAAVPLSKTNFRSSNEHYLIVCFECSDKCFELIRLDDSLLYLIIERNLWSRLYTL